MRLGLLGLLICMNGLVLAVSSYERQLQYEGAPATITVTVRDEHGVPKSPIIQMKMAISCFVKRGIVMQYFVSQKGGTMKPKAEFSFGCRQRIQNTFGNVRRGNLHIWMLYSRQSAIRFLVGFMQEK